jgi:hypothetical protein
VSGFAIHERIIPPAGLARLDIPARSPAGARHLMHDPAVAAFARRAELVDLARDWLGVLSDADVARIVRESTPLDCVVPRGGILVMSPLIIHASSKVRGGAPRRVLHIEYARSLDLAPGVRLAIA